MGCERVDCRKTARFRLNIGVRVVTFWGRAMVRVDSCYSGLIAVIIMVGAYALEARHPIFVLIFAFGCALTAIYAWLIGSMPFVIAEGIWSLIALWRRQSARGK